MSTLRLFIFALLLGGLALAQPTRDSETSATTQRGFMSNMWGWITYPFTGWWSSGEGTPAEPTPETPDPEQQPAPGQPPAQEPEPENPNAKIDTLYSPGTTAWCNDQTCTTIKCTDPSNCTKITCNIYDTNMNGECVVYNTLAPELEDKTPSININTTPAHVSLSTTLKTNTEMQPVIVVDKEKEKDETVVEKIDLNAQDNDED